MISDGGERLQVNGGNCRWRGLGAIRGGGERSQRRAIAGGGEQSEMEGSNQMCRGAIKFGGKLLQVEGSDRR